MGLFDRIFKRNKVKALNESIYERNFLNKPVNFSTSDRGENFTISEVKFHNTVHHFNGKITNLMLAKVVRENNGELENFGSREYIVFEVEPGVNLNRVLLNKMAGYYLHEKTLPENQFKNCSYIGELNNNPKDNYKVKSKTIQKYVDSQLSPQISATKNVQDVQYQNQTQGDFVQNWDISRQNLEENRANILSNDVFLKQRLLHDENYERKYHDYDGTKTDNGKILRIRKLNKVGKDQNGRYLYTAFLKETNFEDDLEKIYSQDEDPVGLPVCFTLDDRFEDIVKNQNPNEIKKILDMLSSRENLDRNWNKLNYIGHLDNSGKVDRDVFANSRPIVNKIKDLQKEYNEQTKDLNNQKELE